MTTVQYIIDNSLISTLNLNRPVFTGWFVLLIMGMRLDDTAGSCGLSAVFVGDAEHGKETAQIAKDAGLGRESLYKTLSPGSKPRYETILKLAKAVGVKFNVEPIV